MYCNTLQHTTKRWLWWLVPALEWRMALSLWWRCVAVCCSVLRCVAVCCSVLQCVAVCCSVLLCVAVCIWRIYKIIHGYLKWCTYIIYKMIYEFIFFARSTIQNEKTLCSLTDEWYVCCSVLQCVAVCCSVLQCVAMLCKMFRCGVVCRTAS